MARWPESGSHLKMRVWWPLGEGIGAAGQWLVRFSQISTLAFFPGPPVEQQPKTLWGPSNQTSWEGSHVEEG